MIMALTAYYRSTSHSQWIDYIGGRQFTPMIECTDSQKDYTELATAMPWSRIPCHKSRDRLREKNTSACARV
uniref:Uncharacterized protein n=1 Tax=Arundo donax TaxID=35708 RepID=A0A0A9BGS8_ARUDO